MLGVKSDSGLRLRPGLIEARADVLAVPALAWDRIRCVAPAVHVDPWLSLVRHGAKIRRLPQAASVTIRAGAQSTPSPCSNIRLGTLTLLMGNDTTFHKPACQTWVPCCAAMDLEQFWNLIEQARGRAADATDSEDIAEQATALLAAHEPQQIIDAQQILWDLMAASYQAPVWAAAYVINGGCSDDGFDYFRGWLITQGRTVFEQVVADVDQLADLPAVRAAAAEGIDLENEQTLSIAWDAYEAATGEELPGDAFTINYPALDPAWNFDFEDNCKIVSRLPRIAALYLD